MCSQMSESIRGEDQDLEDSRRLLGSVSVVH